MHLFKTTTDITLSTYSRGTFLIIADFIKVLLV